MIQPAANQYIRSDVGKPGGSLILLTRVTQFGVFHFRKNIQLATRPDSFIIHVSGDNLYNLFVNGKKVAYGPAKSDLSNWNFETIDIAPFLITGNNVIASTVWNFAEFRSYAQISYKTAFIILGHS